ncbi:MAG: hypothetical protein IIA88_04850 [Bacteroidetes bacterium]|nr:hypothetical protein [Bacteroidota bacterium]
MLGDIEYSAEDAAAEQPPIQGPVIIFKNTNIALRTNYGSNQIQGTNGTFMFYNNIFTGNSGKFNWGAVGISPEALYCEFKEYNFNVKSPTLKADSVTLHYPEVVDYPVEGIFEFQSKKYLDPLKAQYPKFKSYSNDIKIKNFGKNMIYKGGMALIYKGGLALAGNRMNSSSVIGGNCEMSFIGKNKLMFRLLAKKFELGDSLIATKNAYFVLYQYEDSLMDGNRVVFQRKDSIVHPKVKLKYNKNTAMLKLVTGGSMSKHTAFSDSYHNIDIRAEFLHWDLKTPYVNFSIITAKHKVPAFFESREYYDPVRYKQMQGILSFHPLQMVVMYGRLNGKKAFFADHIARDYKKNVNTIKSTCVALHKQGFIDFNAATGLIKLKPKGIHYVYASMGRADFDNMLIRSLSPSGKNATLDLSNNELTVRGIRKFYLSDSMRVFVLPQGNQIKILKDRNLLFNGMLRAGNLLFYGQDFKFDYDGFYVVLEQVDSLKFRLDKVGVLDNQMVIQGGILYINKPNNRSGRKRFPDYPKLAAPQGGKVYFDRDKVLNHAYDKSMYFEIPAFDLDSLNSYDPASFSFYGTFYSGGIFPPFQERLRIMPDYSLGFTHKVPYGGYKLYGKDDARFYDKLTLNNEGLRGPGEIKYLMATLKSDDFVFYLDSTLAIATEGYIQKGNYNEASCPQTTYDRCLMKWLPKLGMYLSNIDIQTPILLYEGDATLDGTTLLTATGLYGIGKVSTSDAETISDKFHFKENDFSARRATFKIASDNPKKPALLCTSIRLDFDMQNLLARWTPEIKGFPSTEFPYSQYKTSIEKGLLDLNKRTVTMHMPEGSDIKNSYFYSTHPDQDSLAFNATGAIYDMDELTLNINGIPEIKVADVFIVPDSNKIFVLENAKIPMLTRAEITMDTLNGYHQFHSGNILINSRNEFEGNAIYDFVNLANDTFRIKFDKFVMGKEAKKKKDIVSTAAHGKVLEEDSIFISPKIFYRGKVALHADKDNLDVDGFIKLQMIGIFKSDNWFKYTNQEDIFNVSVKVKDLVSAQGKPLSTGLHINQRTSQLYSTFISQKYQNTDKDVLPAKGMLYIDPFKSEFKITTPEKEAGLSYQGNVMVYHDSTSEIDYEGKLSLVTIRNDNKSFICDASGSGSAYFSSYDTIYTTDTLFTIDNLTFRKLMQVYDTLYTNDTIYTNDSQFYLPSSLFHLPTKALAQAGLPPRITNPDYIFHLPVPGYRRSKLAFWPEIHSFPLPRFFSTPPTRFTPLILF